MCWQVNSQTIVIGTATTTTTSTGSDPIDGYYNSFRYQVVYTAAELSASLTPYDEITALGFSIAGDYGGGNLLGYTIKMGHTSATNSAAHDNSVTTIVKNPFDYNPTVTAAGVFDMITFDANFVWNGVDNVLVEICSDGQNPYTSPYGQVRANTSVTNGSRFVRADGASSCNTVTGTTNGNRPNIQFNYIDGTPPSCLAPNALLASNITSSSAQLSWTENGTATLWNVQYGLSGFTLGSGTNLIGVANSYVLGALSPNTNYQYYVQADCVSGQSTWSGPFTFKTACVAFPVPFLEGFNTTSISQGCWTVLNVNGDADAWNMDYATTPIEGDQSANLYTDFNAGVNNDYLISPKITLNGNQRLVFKYKVESAGEPNDFEVLLSTTGNTSTDFTTTLSPLTSYSNTTVATKVISLAGTSGDVYFAWHVPAGGLDGWRLYIDEVVVEDIPAVPPTCSTITSPTTGAINVSNSTVTWTSSLDATGYYVSAGYTAGATDVLNLQNVGNVLSYSIPADPATTYFVTVYPYNAFGTATGCTEISFTTCDEIGDFSENFDALTGTGQIPSCWSKVISNGASTYASVGTSTTNNSAPYSIELYNSNSPATSNIMLVTPYINNLSAGTNRLRFFARNQYSDTQDIQVGTMSNPADASTFTVLQSVDLGNSFQEYSVNFAGYTGTDKYIAIRRLSTSTYTYVYIDNVVWEAIPAVIPSCVTITSPTNGAVNIMNSTVSWTSNADATGYRISVGTTSGATDVLNLQDVGNVLSYAFPSDPGTTYFVTVYPYNVTGQASGCTEISFSTCDGLTPDILETFDTFLPSCWQEADGGNAISGPVSFGTGAWTGDGFANSGTTGAIKVNIDYLNDNGWVISPVVSIPTIGYELKFDAAATQYASTTAPTTPWEADDKVEVLVSASGMTNWTVLTTFNTANLPSNTGTNYIIDLDAYAAQDVRFAFRGVEGTVDGGADIDFSVDNFNVRLTPATAPACAAVTATPNPTCGNFSNSISWTAASGANGYRITIGTTSGGTTIANNVDLGNVLSYAFTGTIGTTYYYTVVPYNVVGSATGCTEQSFTTNANGCYCNSTPTSVDATGITNVQIVATNFANTVSTSPVYNNHTATPVNMSQGINNNVQITFNTLTYDYNTVIWVDFNDNYNLEASEIVYTGVSSATSPNILNASFIMPATAPLGQHRMRIVATDDLQSPSNPCYSGAYGETADFTVNIVAASCTPPAATTIVVPACGSGQFSVNVTVTALGNGTPSITDGTTTWPVTALGVVNVGPFASGSSVTLTLLHGADGTCDLPLGSSTYTCPAANDDLCNAIPLTVNATSTGTAYGNVGATAQNSEPVPGCFSDNINGSVWFSFVAPASGEVNITTDIAGATLTDTEIAVYAATGVTCSDLTTLGAALGCDQDSGITINYNSFLNLPNLTPGATYYIQVDDYGFGTTKGSFGLEVAEVLASDSFDNNSFVAYPNPVKDVFNVSYTSEISSVRVMNLLGQEVLSREVNATSTQIDMSQLSTGAYIVNVTVGDTIKTIKVVKQ